MPFLRLIAPLIAGIILALYFPSYSSWIYIIAGVSFCLLLLWNWYDSKNQNFSRRWIYGAMAGLFLGIAGYSITLLKQPFHNKFYFEHYLQKGSDSLLVTIISQPQEKEKTLKATVEVNRVISNGKTIETTGKAIFYFAKDSLAYLIKYGDVLFVHAPLEYVKPASNPDEFDYKNYLALHGIYREGYVKDNEFIFTNYTNAPWLLSFTNKCREKLISLLNEKIKGDEANIASAILLGYRDDLSQTVIHQFADSGTIHVICVAGLHVGILFWLLGLLLLPLEKLKHGKLIRTILLVLFLWLYALFTGLATPVLRTTVMFSFLVIGRHFGRYTNTVNTLAASAFLMLLINPFSIADTGFQLSYLSVLGIIVIYPLLKELFEFRNFIAGKIWELTCLSASAQIAIAPLSLLYFHQFPNYFILTNLLIVPLLSIVIYSGVLFFITVHIPFISVVTTWILQKSLLLMNSLVGKAPHLPLFVTKGVSISIPEAMILYLALICLFVFWFNKKYRSLFIALFCFTLFLGIRVWKDHTNSNQQIFAVYNIPKHSAIAFLSGKQSVLIQPVDSLNFCYHIQCHWWDRGIIDSTPLRKDTNAVLLSNHLCIRHNFAIFNKDIIGFVRNNEDLPSTPQKIRVHYLVVSGNYKWNMAALQNAFIFDKLIFDSSVSPYRLKKWKEECEQLHIGYYDVNTQGAFIENC